MATDLYTVTLQAESKGVTQTKQAMDGLGKSTSLATKAIGLFGAAFAGIGIASTFKKITQDTMAFTKSISELSAITGATGKDLEFYEKQAALIGKTTTLSASQAATAFKLIASAKPDLLKNAEALAAVTKEAVKLAEAAGVDLADAASTVGVSLNQFGADASEAARFVNVLAAGAKEGSSSIQDTSMAMKNAGVAARLAGLSFEEANVGVQLLAKGGLFAAEAGTGFRQVLLKLENEAENRFKPSMVGLAGALENLAAENMNLTELTDLFGAEAMKSAAIMINGAGDARTLEKALTGTSTATEMAATNFDNLDGDILSLNSANEGLAITLGKMLEPAMRKTIKAVTDFSRKVDDFVKTDKFVKYLEITINALKLLSALIVAQLISALAAAITTFAAAATAATLFGRALTLMGGPIGVAVIALYGLYEILNKVVGTNTDNLTRELQTAANKGVEPLAEHIKELEQRQIKLKIAVDAATQSAKYSSAAANQLSSSQAELEAVTSSLADAEILLEEKLSLSNTTTDVSSAATNQLTAEFEALTNSLQNHVIPEIDIGTNSLSEMTTRVEGFVGPMQEMTTQVQGFVGPMQQVIEETDKGTVAFELQKNMLRNLQEDFGDLIYKTLTDGKANFKDFFGSIVEGFKKMVAELAAQKIMDAIFGSGGLNGFMSSLSEGFSSIFATIGSSIASMASKAASGIASIVGGGAAAGGAAAGGAAAGGATVGGTLAAGAAKVGGTLAAAGSKALALATGPAGLTVLAAAALGKVLDSGGTPTSTAGLTMAKTAGMSDANIFQTEEFASGFAPLGFKQNATNEQAEAAINPIRQLDASLTEIASGLGYKVDLSGHTFSGLGVEGTGAGTVLGTFVEEGKQKGTPLDKQLDNYASEWIKAVGARNGVSEQVIKDVIGGGSASGILTTAAGLVDGSHQSGLSSVPYDGYIAELHAGERVQTSAQVAATDRMSSEMVGLRNNLNELMLVVAKAVTKTARIEDRWDKNGLPPVRA